MDRGAAARDSGWRYQTTQVPASFQPAARLKYSWASLYRVALPLVSDGACASPPALEHGPCPLLLSAGRRCRMLGPDGRPRAPAGGQKAPAGAPGKWLVTHGDTCTPGQVDTRELQSWPRMAASLHVPPYRRLSQVHAVLCARDCVPRRGCCGRCSSWLWWGCRRGGRSRPDAPSAARRPPDARRTPPLHNQHHMTTLSTDKQWLSLLGPHRSPHLTSYPSMSHRTVASNPSSSNVCPISLDAKPLRCRTCVLVVVVDPLGRRPLGRLAHVAVVVHAAAVRVLHLLPTQATSSTQVI